MTERTASEKAILVRSCVLGALGASALVALGRFREALALTLGAAVAILSALWLSDVLARLVKSTAPRGGAVVRFDWKFGLKVALRYAVMGTLLCPPRSRGSSPAPPSSSWPSRPRRRSRSGGRHGMEAGSLQPAEMSFGGGATRCTTSILSSSGSSTLS